MNKEIDWEKIKDRLVIQPLDQDPFLKIAKVSETYSVQRATEGNYSKFLKSIKTVGAAMLIILVLILIIGIFMCIWNYYNAAIIVNNASTFSENMSTLFKKLDEFERIFQTRADSLKDTLNSISTKMNSIIKTTDAIFNNLNLLTKNITSLNLAYGNFLEKYDVSLIASSLKSNLYILITFNRTATSPDKPFNITKVEIKPSIWKSILEKHKLTFCVVMENFSSLESNNIQICFRNQTGHLFKQPVPYQGEMILIGQLNSSNTILPVSSYIIGQVPIAVKYDENEQKMEIKNVGDEKLLVIYNQTRRILRPQNSMEITLPDYYTGDVVIQQLNNNLIIRYIISLKNLGE